MFEFKPDDMSDKSHHESQPLLQTLLSAILSNQDVSVSLHIGSSGARDAKSSFSLQDLQSLIHSEMKKMKKLEPENNKSKVEEQRFPSNFEAQANALREKAREERIRREKESEKNDDDTRLTPERASEVSYFNGRRIITKYVPVTIREAKEAHLTIARIMLGAIIKPKPEG